MPETSAGATFFGKQTAGNQHGSPNKSMVTDHCMCSRWSSSQKSQETDAAGKDLPAASG
jgi:hypothetical protein